MAERAFDQLTQQLSATFYPELKPPVPR